MVNITDDEHLATNSDDATYSGQWNALTPPAEEEEPYRYFILEPAVFLIFLAKYLSGTVYQNQILYQTCLTILEVNATECEALKGLNRESDEIKKLEVKVQEYSADIMMTNSLFDSIIPAVIILFLGPWSDKFGRRPILLTTFSGYLISCIALIVLSFITETTNISPWWFTLYSVPSIFCGGTCALITGIYCYICDVAKERNRALRMVLNEAALCSGMMMGNVASGYIYAATSALTLFIIAGCLMLLSLIYIVFFVPESLKPEDIQTGSRIREFFRFDLVKDLIRTCFKTRPNYDRAIIWMTMIVLTIMIFDMEGLTTINYMFVREKFNWTVKDFSLFNAARIVVQIVGSIVGTIMLRRLFKLSIITMAMLALACCVLESTVRATAQYWQEMYFGMSLGNMRGVLGPMGRAIISHIVPISELGKLYALTTSVEFLSPLVAAPLYTTVYKATVNSYPGAFNFISAGLYFFSYILVAIIFGIQKSMDYDGVYQAIGS
ncbi:uncharacterized protein Dwil_GK23339 [Drosophila willistoni]|uniref:Major facilitator superfamily (MFS) profile domain-containing protein n=1 Tax=Drosophila willistoni TaxID=7260 RepID=B4NNL5_DROWI|nr:proton-coupled folate transporter [Drosophila willistoni]EDW85954.1 uncharacterized protein Dwil_GK23339 [Drosophila willistoni]